MIAGTKMVGMSKSEMAPPQFDLRKLFRLVTILSLPLALIAYVARQNVRRQAELNQLKKQDASTLAALITELNSICSRIGRAPKDTEELESLMGKPLPKVHDHRHPIPITIRVSTSIVTGFIMNCLPRMIGSTIVAALIWDGSISFTNFIEITFDRRSEFFVPT